MLLKRRPTTPIFSEREPRWQDSLTRWGRRRTWIENNKGRRPLAVAVLLKNDDAARVLLRLEAHKSKLEQELARSLSLLSLEDGQIPRDTARTHASDYDQLLVWFILRKCSSRPLPLPIISQIFDLPYDFLRTTAYRDDYQLIIRRSPLLPYVKSTLITGGPNIPVQRIIFKTCSHA